MLLAFIPSPCYFLPVVSKVLWLLHRSVCEIGRSLRSQYMISNAAEAYFPYTLTTFEATIAYRSRPFCKSFTLHLPAEIRKIVSINSARIIAAFQGPCLLFPRQSLKTVRQANGNHIELHFIAAIRAWVSCRLQNSFIRKKL